MLVDSYQSGKDESSEGHKPDDYHKLMANNFKTYEEGPRFDTKLQQNLTAIHGKTAQLMCRVIDLGNRTVSSKSFDIIILPWQV